MVIRLPKPLIATQLDRALELICRVRDGQLICVFIYGKKGIGKTEIVNIAYRESCVHLEPIPDATLYGMRQMFIANPSGHFWLNDNDQWMKQQRDVNFMKRVLEGGFIEAINRDTLREQEDGDVEHVTSNIRLIVTSNANFDALSAEQRNHVEAVTDRGSRINISSDPRELLRFLDWWVVEQDYFTTEMFRREANINRRLSLREIQDVLNFIHAYAWRLPLSLRMLRSTAVERVMSPADWDTKLIAGLLPEALLKIPLPPAPEMFGRNVREGLPSKPTGYERRQANRMQRGRAAPTQPDDDPDPDDDPPPPPSGHDAPTPPDERTTPDLPPNPDPPEPESERGTAQDFKHLLKFGWPIAEIAEKYGISPAEVERMTEEPPPICKTINQAITEIYLMRGRTCESVAKVLRRLPIHEWDQDTRREVADDLWQTTESNLWWDGERANLIEAYFQYGSALCVFATDTEVLRFDDEHGLRIVTWAEITELMAPHIAEQRQRHDRQRRKDEGDAIFRSKLPKIRKLKAMHQRIDRLRELKLTIKDRSRQQAIDLIRDMENDDPDFAACATFADYLHHATRRMK